jgi:phosphoglycerate dehydrogenase-like enzyme
MIPRLPRPFVLQSEDLDPAAAAWLRESCDLTACHFSDPAFFPLLANADGLVVRTYTKVDAALLDQGPRLKVVGRAGVGLDRIDVPECRTRGIQVVHTPDANTQAVAEYVFTLLQDTLRPRTTLAQPVTPENWNQLRRDLLAINQLSELTLGILGLGRVGSRVARIARGYGMEVLYHDLLDLPEPSRHGARPTNPDDLLRRADILSIHIDSRPTNYRLITTALLAQLRPTVTIVNTSRGLVMDADALATFLRANPHARALIDVHDPEPFDATYPLLGLTNATLSPHLAASTATAHVNMSWVVKDVWRALNGEKPEHPAP